jgi:hypothetical protein
MKDEAVFSGEDSSLTPVSAFDPDTGLGQKRSSARTRATIIDDRGPGAKLSGTIGQKPTQVGRVSAF